MRIARFAVRVLQDEIGGDRRRGGEGVEEQTRTDFCCFRRRLPNLSIRFYPSYPANPDPTLLIFAYVIIFYPKDRKNAKNQQLYIRKDPRLKFAPSTRHERAKLKSKKLSST
jgi:hypothetical protein